ncbi:methyltransferase domain-containing protein [Roseovarius sp. EL26]|uniref:methyltransferase domain-containing protein n=1 Tax=Roseovarius sp. EL26 TaxID=2126672 RepID=UPI000EA291AA|nr:methyltransferase domain-containing protein [Roseovarius sp. EL26]
MTPQMSMRVQRSFSRSFDTYDEASSQQIWVANHLAHLLGQSGAPKAFEYAFEFGCGTGHLTQALCQNFEFSKLILNDITPEADHTAAIFGAEFLPGDVATTAWPNQVDLVASASMIQWLQDPAKLMAEAARHLAPGGWLAVSGFGQNQYCQLSQLGSSAKAPGLCQPEDLVAAISDEIEVIEMGEAERCQYFPSPRHVLHHLRQTGVNGRAQKGWNKTRLAQFTSEYVDKFGTEHGVPLTYHPIWIVGRKRA